MKHGAFWYKLNIPWISCYCEPLREKDFRVTLLSSAFSLPYRSSAPCCSYNGKGIYLLEKGEVKPLTEQRHRPRHINA